jgi:hypothetical protein
LKQFLQVKSVRMTNLPEKKMPSTTANATSRSANEASLQHKPVLEAWIVPELMLKLEHPPACMANSKRGAASNL